MWVAEQFMLHCTFSYGMTREMGYVWRRIKVWGVGGCIALAALPALAASSPYDDYYKRQEAAGAAVPSAPVDNDSYYTAPGQYNRQYYSVPGQVTPPAKSKSSGCNTISDSPECL